ncbi:3' exoribonuclease family, domain 2 containing protein [Plasmodiophora brassicae]|nr:hypothetical protein PBRA_003501 [Plasmodiophora brassicae]
METVISTVEREFISSALALPSPQRIDGRRPFDQRNVSISFPGSRGYSLVQVGRTRVSSRVTAELVEPPLERPTEGSIRFFVDFANDKTASATISNIIEKCIRDSGAVDVETLCVLAGKRVWALRVDIIVMDSCGNVIDCACIAALSSLRHFRRRAVTVTGTELVVHSEKERAPVALQIHHLPICSSFAVIGDVVVADPSGKEARIAGGVLTIACNTRRHICHMSKSGGTPVPLKRLEECIQVACDRAEVMSQLIQQATADDDAKRQKLLETGHMGALATLHDAPVLVVTLPESMSPPNEPAVVSDMSDDDNVVMDEVPSAPATTNNGAPVAGSEQRHVPEEEEPDAPTVTQKRKKTRKKKAKRVDGPITSLEQAVRSRDEVDRLRRQRQQQTRSQ